MILQHFNKILFSSVDKAANIVTVVYRADLIVTCQYVGGGYLFQLPFYGEGDFYVKLGMYGFWSNNIYFDVFRATRSKTLLISPVHLVWSLFVTCVIQSKLVREVSH